MIFGSLDLGGSAIAEELDFSGAIISGRVDLGGASLSRVNALRASIAGSVLLGSVFADEIELRSSAIEGSLWANEASVSGHFTITRATIGESLLLDGGDFGSLSMSGATVAGLMRAFPFPVVVHGALDAQGASVGANVLLNGSRFRSVNLDDFATGTIHMSGVHVADRLTAARVSVRDDFQLTRNHVSRMSLVAADVGGNLAISSADTNPSVVVAERAAIGGDLQFTDASVNYLSLTDATVGGGLVLSELAWSSGSQLHLQGASVRKVSIAGDYRESSLSIDLLGFAYSEWAAPDPASVGSAWFVEEWLSRMNGFHPEPYEQLAQVLDQDGYASMARSIRYASRDAQRGHAAWTEPERWGMQAFWLVLGYGLRPWRAVYWFTGLWLTGFLILAATSRGNLRSRGAGLYSLDRMLPALNLSSSEEDPRLTTWQNRWFAFQAIVGWLLVLVVLGWLASLIVAA